MKKLSQGSEKLYSHWQDRFRDWLDGRPATAENGEAFLASRLEDKKGGSTPDNWLELLTSP